MIICVPEGKNNIWVDLILNHERCTELPIVVKYEAFSPSRESIVSAGWVFGIGRAWIGEEKKAMSSARDKIEKKRKAY